MKPVNNVEGKCRVEPVADSLDKCSPVETALFLQRMAVEFDDPSAADKIGMEVISLRLEKREVDLISALIFLREGVRAGDAPSAEALWRCAEAAVMLLHNAAFKNPEMFRRYAEKQHNWPVIKSVLPAQDRLVDDVLKGIGLGTKGVLDMRGRKVSLADPAIQFLIRVISTLVADDLNQSSSLGIQRKLPTRVIRDNVNQWTEVIARFVEASPGRIRQYEEAFGLWEKMKCRPDCVIQGCVKCKQKARRKRRTIRQSIGARLKSLSHSY